MKKHLLFFDIDGTLRDEQTGFVSSKTREAVRAARANGHFAFLNTGRSFAELDSDILEVGFDGLVCGCGTYVSFGEQILVKEEISGQKAYDILKLLQLAGVQGLLEGEEYFYTSRTADHKTLLQVIEGFGPEVNTRLRYMEDELPKFQKMSVWLGPDHKFSLFQDALKEEFDFIRRESDFYEVIPKGYSKATGIAYLAEYLGVDPKHTVAVGDSTNDLSMLQYAGLSIAMGNSKASVKEKVKFVTKSVEDEGIFYALARFGFV